MSRREPPIHVGWYEYADLPEWGIRGLRTKIDTGARSAAIHVGHVEELRGERVRFDVVRARGGRRVSVEAKVVRRGNVRSSTGHRQRRIFVETLLRLGPVEHRIVLNLVDRSDLTFRMILGRTAFRGTNAVVDVHRSCLVTRRRSDGPGKVHS